jgi:hypothetical protein
MRNNPTLVQEAERAQEQADPESMSELIRMLTFLPQYARAARPTETPRRQPIIFTNNKEMWAQFYAQQLPDTSRIRLEHFHLFEWFPLSPGRFHTREGQRYRQDAAGALERQPDGSYYNPYGKVNMIHGGVGAVKLKSRPLLNQYGQSEYHYFMTASSNGVCHEGVPVMVPRHRYADLIARLRHEGAVPVVLEGEMKLLPESARSFFEKWRLSHTPNLVLHVEDIEALPQPRHDVTRYLVAIALSFYGLFREQRGVYMSYATFDSASPTEREQKIGWLKQYVQQYQGQVITDFDEEFPEFKSAPFALKRVMSGELDPLVVQEVMNELGYFYFGNSAEAVQEAIHQHNNYYVNIVGPRGVQVGGSGGGPIVTGDDNIVVGAEQP